MHTTRRQALAGLGAAVCAAGASATNAAQPPVVTLLGDSISSGYGLPASQALPRQLQTQLLRLGKAVTVRGAGVAGDTTAGARTRLARAVSPETRLCVVALGANDVLRGVAPHQVRANLAAIVTDLRRREVKVVVAALHAPSLIGARYAQDFNAVFADVARQPGVTLAPDWLGGVLGDKRLNQPDGIHPNAEGVRRIAARLAPIVLRSLNS